MRLIDGDKLIEAIDKWQDTLSLETTAIDCVICDVLDSVLMIIDDMETVEEGGNNEAEKACHDERKKTIRKNKHAEADYVGFVVEGMTRFGNVRKKKKEQ